MSIKNYSRLVLAVLVGTLFMFSCNTDQSKFPGFKKSDSGLYYKFHVKGGDTTKAQMGDLISTYMDYRTDDTVFNTTPTEHPFSLPLMESTYTGDVFAALAMMSAGDSATFMIHADSFFTKTVGAPRPDFLDSNSYFYLDVKVVEIKSQAQLDKEKMEKGKEMAAMEVSLIEQYVADNKLTIERDGSGIYFSKIKNGKGKAASAGDFVSLEITAQAIGAQKEFINSKRDGKPIDFEVGTGQLGIGFETGLAKMKTGDEAIIIVPFNLAFGAQGMQRYIDPYATIVFQIKMLSVSTADQIKAKKEKEAKNAMAKSASEVKNYLKANKITTKPNASGLYYVETVEGSGKQAVAGKKVKVHYTGTLLNGTKFDSSLDRGQPFEFTLGQGQVIRGWDEGVALMKEGGKATLIIPSDLGYGPRGAGASIPPNATLVFEVELLEVIE